MEVANMTLFKTQKIWKGNFLFYLQVMFEMIHMKKFDKVRGVNEN